MKEFLSTIATPFVWFFTTLTGPMVTAKIIICLLAATAIYLVLQLAILSSIGEEYERQKKEVFNDAHPYNPDHAEKLERQFKRTLKEDRYYNFLTTLRRILRGIVGIIYTGIFYVTLHETLATHFGSETIGTAISLGIGLASCGLSIALCIILVVLYDIIDTFIWNIKNDRKKSQEAYTKKQQEDARKRADDYGIW